MNNLFSSIFKTLNIVIIAIASLWFFLFMLIAIGPFALLTLLGFCNNKLDNYFDSIFHRMGI